MITRTKPPELHPLGVINLLGVAVAPLDGHVGIGVGVDEHVEGTVAGELGEEGDGGGDLAEDGGDFVLDFFFGFFEGLVIGAGGGWRVSRGREEVEGGASKGVWKAWAHPGA